MLICVLPFWYPQLSCASSLTYTIWKETCVLEDCIEGGEYKLYILGTGNLSDLKGFDSYLLIKDVPTVIFIPISQET